MPNYIQTEPMKDRLISIQANLDDLPEAAIGTGIRCDDADVIMTDVINSVGRNYEKVREYRTDNFNRNRQPLYGSVYTVSFSDWSMGSEIRSVHPAVVITANWMRGSDTIVVIPLTTARSRRDRILENRRRPREEWNDEAWTCIPVNVTPNEVSFVDLKQIRVITPARIKMNANGLPERICALRPDEIREIEESMARYFNLGIVNRMERIYGNLQEVRQADLRKIRALRRSLMASKSAIEALQNNPGINAQVVLRNVLNEIESALEL